MFCQRKLFRKSIFYCKILQSTTFLSKKLYLQKVVPQLLSLYNYVQGYDLYELPVHTTVCFEIDSDDGSFPLAVSVQHKKQLGLSFLDLKTISLTEKFRSGERIKYKAFVGCGDDVTKMRFGVSIANTRVKAINQAITLALKLFLNTPLSTGKYVDKRREENYGSMFVELTRSKGGFFGNKALFSLRFP